MLLKNAFLRLEELEGSDVNQMGLISAMVDQRSRRKKKAQP